MLFPIEPVPKPRMTQRDKWAKRPAVVRYFAYCDKVRALGVAVPEGGARIFFHVPMPKSWSKRKRAAMAGQPHRQKPDLDNYEKALLDACLADDCGVWDLRCTKLWAERGSIEVLTGEAGEKACTN